jgi:two-component system NarL family sensor kinase
VAAVTGRVARSDHRSRWSAVAIGAMVVAFGIGAIGLAAYSTFSNHDNPYASNQFAVGVTGVAVGGFVAFRRPEHPLGWILLVGSAFSFVSFAGYSVLNWMFVHTPERIGLAKVILHSSIWGWIVTRGSFVVLAPLVFPTGWPRARWERALFALAVSAIAVTCAAHSRLWTFEYFDGAPATGTARLAEWVEPWAARVTYVLALVALVSMAARVLRSERSERRRHLPFAAGLLVLAVPTLNSLYADAFGHGLWPATDWLEVWAMVALPVVLAVAVLRHGALDIDVVVRRTTVYAVVIAVAAAVYVSVVAVFSVFVQHGSGAGPVVATGLVALVVLPARAWADGVVSRRLFGNRDAPFEVITALGARLEQAPIGGEGLELVAETLRVQLRVPFVAVELIGPDSVVETAAAGSPGPPVERFPLVYQGVDLGWLVVAQRGGRDSFRPSERALLAAFARQAGVVAHNVALAQALLQSRAVLVQTREEERRRIRRDLHDGLGPTLATVSLSLGAAAERLDGDPELAVLLRDLETEVQHSIADIRRLVYDLRPPVLDDLGLVGALRGQAAQLSQGDLVRDRVAIDVEASGTDADLPSAVELAAYRVAVEAMTNVVRHANASRCVVAIERNHQLVVRVEDDGVGIPADTPRGVGLRSMRERVVELGGALRLERRLPAGTTVWAAFPLEGFS